MSDWLRWLLIAIAVLGGLAVVGWRRVRIPDFPQFNVRVGIGLSVVAWLLIAIVIAAGTAGGLLWFLGWPRLPSAGVFDVNQLLDLLKIALSVVAGFGGVVLLAVNYRKQRVTENEHALAVEKAERETVQGFNERLGTAAEQLAHDSPAVRLTGVYALTGLADDWVDKRQVCVDVLCGYLRLQPEVMTRGEAEVRQAILRVIRDRLTGLRWWQPVDFDFSGVVFENADFSRLRFRGRLNLDGAEFTGELTSFDSAHFSGGLSCHGTRFAADRTTFRGAWFDAAAEFVGAEFAGRVLECPSMMVESTSLDFYRCQFRCAELDFSGTSLADGVLRFEKAEFADAELDFGNLHDGWAARKAGFPRLLFRDCRFVRCHLRLELYVHRERMIWLTGSVLDTVTVAADSFDDVQPWLNLRNVDLRGGTEIPERFVRRETLA